MFCDYWHETTCRIIVLVGNQAKQNTGGLKTLDNIYFYVL